MGFIKSFFISALLALSSTATAGDALISLYFFKSGVPQSGVQLYDGEQLLNESGENGAMHLYLAARQYQLTINQPSAGFQQTLDLVLSEDESMQLIVTLPKQQGGSAIFDIESSHKSGDSLLEVVATKREKKQDESGPKGTIRGRVMSLTASLPVPGAKIFVSGLAGDFRSDVDGYFSIQAPEDRYSISVVHSDFSTQTLSSVEVVANETFEHIFELTPSTFELKELVVSGPAIEGGLLALSDERRTSSSVSEVLGASEMSSSGDSDAAGALKRVTGLTIVGGKYIYVRGMGERYSSVTMNGTSLPSPNPYRRAVELDLIPTNVLGAIVVQKTYSPEMPGDFGGGAVQLRTAKLAEDRFKTLSISVGGNSQSLFQEGRTYEGGAYDLLGFDDGSRAMPGKVESGTQGGRTDLNGTDQENEVIAESFSRNYAVENMTIMPNVGIKYSVGDRWEDYSGDSDTGWGYLFSVKYSNNWSHRAEEEWDYSLNGQGGLVSEDEYTREITENEIELSGVLHLGYEIGSEHAFGSTTMLARKTVKSVEYEELFLAENEITARDITLDWEERQLFTQQFTGQHYFEQWQDLSMDWSATYALATQYAPDRRKYRYEQSDDGVWAFSRFGESNQRFFDEMSDEVFSLGLDFKLPLYDLWSANTDLKFGLAYEDKERDASSAGFRLVNNRYCNNANCLVSPDELISDSPNEALTNDNIGADGYELDVITMPEDAFRAQRKVSAQYLLGEFNYESAKVMAGLRAEQYNPYAETYRLDNPLVAVETPAKSSRVILPALSLTWLLNQQHQMRFAYSKTVNRPELKEITDARWLNRENGSYYRGNPELEEAEISHFDIRWENYLTRFETISLALFYKSFDRPIEEITRLGGGNEVTFFNVAGATNYGIELQGRAWLSRFFGRSMSRFFIDTNMSLIESSVELGDEADNMTSKERPLQGQSPWVINLKLGYENLVAMTESSLMFNMAGERITKVETSGVPDVYEQPVPTLDFVYQKTLVDGFHGEKWKLKVNIKNLLDPTIESTKGGQVEKRYKRGRSIKVTLVYDFPS